VTLRTLETGSHRLQSLHPPTHTDMRTTPSLPDKNNTHAHSYELHKDRLYYASTLLHVTDKQAY